MTVDLEPSKIHYDSFVRGQTDGLPLRNHSSIARDTAKDIYKTTGMESARLLLKIFRKNDHEFTGRFDYFIYL